MRRAALALLLVTAAIAARAENVSIGWISRSPEIPYVWNSANPAVEGWPAEGDAVTWTAHVRNLDAAPVQVAYEWRLDGQRVANGTMAIAANDVATIDLPWQWTFARHTLELRAGGKSLLVYTDSIAAGFWIEQSAWNAFRARLPQLGLGLNTFEDWIELRTRMFNDMAPIAIYPETPQGVIDRVRVQKIVIVPDGTLPANGLRCPAPDDRTIDVQWGFPASIVTAYTNLDARGLLSESLYHELGHARYLVDVYGWYVLNDPPDSAIALTVPLKNGSAHEPDERGLMVQHYTFIDRYSAAALNRIAHHRAIRGTCNEPENIGEFLNDLPADNRVRIVDASGDPLRNTDVKIYQATPSGSYTQGHQPYTKRYDAKPDLSLRTDGDGWIDAGRNPFSSGPIVHREDGSNVTAIVQAGGRFGYLESAAFNLAYWRGAREVAEHTVVVGGPICPRSFEPLIDAPQLEAALSTNTVTLTWHSPSKSSATYSVFASIDAAPPRLLGTTTATSLTATLGGNVQWWVEATIDGCPTRSETARFSAPPFPAARRRSVKP